MNWDRIAAELVEIAVNSQSNAETERTSHAWRETRSCVSSDSNHSERLNTKTIQDSSNGAPQRAESNSASASLTRSKKRNVRRRRG